MEKNSKTNKKIQLVFPRLKEYDVYLPQDLSQYKDRKFFDLLKIDINELLSWFQGFRVESIELVVDSIINTHNETKLIVAKEQDRNGVKFLLKPNDKITVDLQLHKSQGVGAGQQ